MLLLCARHAAAARLLLQEPYMMNAVRCPAPVRRLTCCCCVPAAAHLLLQEPYMIPDTVPSMMRRVDADGDGSMSYEEFAGLLQVRLFIVLVCAAPCCIGQLLGGVRHAGLPSRGVVLVRRCSL
jgi:hypothetical protein